MAPASSRAAAPEVAGYSESLERATRGLLDLNVVVLEHMERRIGLPALRALQALDRLGPSQVTELGAELGLVPSSASRLSDRLAAAGLVSRGVSPRNRRATILDLTSAGRAVLTELVDMRVRLFREVAEQMPDGDRAALLHGAAAFTSAQQEVGAPEIDC
ncbi:MarR family transcriptional regulator [Mycobacterium sp. Y57]|uniref:MarR family winged helix-turn-helix transcriptional regulator n=1 Tax=Mycolicibacterium xanthum TaxID=2796469 RepID=UPI001C854731|nr:MarR family transcriptional regulator [Mycolicibacterium xanthum]MBX7434344.1 MarR family transcriptional regulator [Mycolicibacterium xanthum]